MNPPSFTGSYTTKDPENFIEELKKVFDVIHIIDDERVKLSARNRKMWLGLGFISGRRAEIRMHHIRGSVAQGGTKRPACPKCSRSYSGVFCEGSNCCVKYDQTGHFRRECPKNKQGSGRMGNRDQSSSAAPLDRVAPRGVISGTSRGTNLLYALNYR
ncbi:uncharacterized protein LOC107016548 [Solanum pennellii]|uniref:Uncharacterized protein LOC107016548 n=1 Tax=Solanum pennellii TaxID=28526 RepID=A0ABM1GKS9_SOLPN|nr:uncharacterized protein LOC107016548 [Solanum pennellii]